MLGLVMVRVSVRICFRIRVRVGVRYVEHVLFIALFNNIAVAHAMYQSGRCVPHAVKCVLYSHCVSTIDMQYIVRIEERYELVTHKYLVCY